MNSLGPWPNEKGYYGLITCFSSGQMWNMLLNNNLGLPGNKDYVFSHL